jgi:hypothetical protein
MKKYILFIAAFLMAHAAFASPTPPTSPLPNDDEEEAIYLNDQLKVVSQTQHEENKPLYYTITATYPQITGQQLTDAAKKFNMAIKQIMASEIQQFKNSVKRDLPHIQALPETVRQNSFKMDYDIDTLHPDQLSLISVRLNIEGMQAGRAHPFHLHRVLNFDMTHSKELVLRDLFKPHTPYLSAIAKYSNQKLTASLNDKWMIPKGTQANAANYKNWNIQSDSILITFDEYQVAPYTAGPQEVEVPFSALQHLFSKQALIIASAQDPVNNVG